MASRRTVIALLLSTLASFVTAQQGVLVNGNSQLPACAQGCTPLQQAAQACPGGTSSANQQTWICFCQSAYLTNLKISTSASTVCSSACTNPSDNSQIAKWYASNCGSDNGASEHAGGSSGSAATTAAAAGSSASATAAGTAAATASNTIGGSDSSSNFSAGTSQASGDWWSNHYQWIIMCIVLAILLPLIAWLGIWLKRRHDRKRDQISGGFNAGITHRSAPMSDPNLNASGIAGSGIIDGSGRNSPARTRDAFMPYGYGYSRSESRLESKQAVGDDRRSPLARGSTPMDPEKEAGMGGATPAKKLKRVLVREKSTGDDIEKAR